MECFYRKRNLIQLTKWTKNRPDSQYLGKDAKDFDNSASIKHHVEAKKPNEI